MTKEAEIRRGGRCVTARIGRKSATFEFNREISANPDDWKGWVEQALNLEFNHSAEVTKVEPDEGVVRFMCRGGAREGIEVKDTKPRSLKDGDSLR